jgi:hypothetical protein
MLLLAIWYCFNFKSFAMTSDKSGGKAYHDQKAIMKPNQEKKNTLPYMLKGLRAGIDLAFLLTGFTNGACHRVAGENMVVLLLLLLLWSSKYSGDSSKRKEAQMRSIEGPREEQAQGNDGW